MEMEDVGGIGPETAERDEQLENEALVVSGSALAGTGIAVAIIEEGMEAAVEEVVGHMIVGALCGGGVGLAACLGWRALQWGYRLLKD